MTTTIGPNIPTEVHPFLRDAAEKMAPGRKATARRIATPRGTLVRLSWPNVTERRYLVWDGPTWEGIFNNERSALLRIAAGLVQYSKARSTGTYVAVYDGEPAGMDTEGGRWQTVCEAHAFIVSHGSLSLARDFASVPEEWCEACRMVQDGGCPCATDGHDYGDDLHAGECPLRLVEVA